MTNRAASEPDSASDPDGPDALPAVQALARACIVPIAPPPVGAKHPTPAAFLPPGPWIPNPFHPVRHLMLESTDDLRLIAESFRRR